LADIIDKNIGISSISRVCGNTGRADSIQVFAANRNSDYELGESVTILVEGVLQSSDFPVDSSLATRSPETEKKRCASGDYTSRSQLLY